MLAVFAIAQLPVVIWVSPMRHTVKANAQAFAVRRVGERHEWCITLAEIGALTGLSVSSGNTVMQERGHRIDRGFVGRKNSAKARKLHMERGFDVDVNEMELTDIFS